MENNLIDPTDLLLAQARDVVLSQQNPSTAFLQRHFKIGHDRALKLMQCMEGDVVTVPDANGWRRMKATGAMSADDPQYTGIPCFEPYKRLCFYPSSGDWGLWILLRLDCDVFVLSEQRRDAVSWRRIQAQFKKQGLPVALVHQSDQHLCFRSQSKTVWIFIEDNNACLERMARSGLVISHFVGICDGCAEGGNYECVHERPFMSRLLPLAANGMAITTDHSRPMERRPYNWGGGVPVNIKFEQNQSWVNYPEPPLYQRRILPDLHDQVPRTTRFELQGVLVAPDVEPQRQIGDRLKERDLVVLPKGQYPTQLNAMVPFRTLGGRGILAEFRVSWVEGENLI